MTHFEKNILNYSKQEITMDKSKDYWKLATISLFFLMTIGFGFYFTKVSSISQNQDVKVIIPEIKQPIETIISINQSQEITARTKADYSWIPIYFGTINKRTEVAQIPKLKSLTLPKDDMEIRFWFPMGIFLLEGFILKKHFNQWSAIYLEGTEEKINKIQYQEKLSKYQKELPEPVSGWDNTWNNLVNKGILTLPDATEVNCNEIVVDGFSLIIEYKINGIYRTYKYDNPNDKAPKCREAKQIAEIYKIINDEFRFREYNL